jgi:hypothetical protein
MLQTCAMEVMESFRWPFKHERSLFKCHAVLLRIRPLTRFLLFRPGNGICFLRLLRSDMLSRVPSSLVVMSSGNQLSWRRKGFHQQAARLPRGVGHCRVLCRYRPLPSGGHSYLSSLPAHFHQCPLGGFARIAKEEGFRGFYSRYDCVSCI